MDPYRRDPLNSEPEQPPPLPDDEPAILWIAFFVGLLPPVSALVRGVVWGAEPTIGLLIGVLAGIGLVVRARNTRREKRQGRGDGTRD